MSFKTYTKIKQVASYIVDEYVQAKSKFPSCHSYHEGYAVLLEEMDELWTEIKNSKPDMMPRDQNIFRESTQVAAMALDIMITALHRMEQGRITNEF